MSKTFLEEFIKEYENDPDYIYEGLVLMLAERIYVLMEEQNISKDELAQKLGVSRTYVTKLLNGTLNLSIKTLVKISLALNADFKIILYKRDGDFGACIKENPTCSAYGETQGQAVTNLREVFEEYIEIAQEKNYPVYPPDNRISETERF